MSDVKILLVDDQAANLIALESILKPLGHQLVMANSGSSALRQLLLHDFAVILLDVHMPGMDGYETAAIVRQRERTAHTPIVFLTAESGNRGAMLRAYDQGAVDFLIKPFEAPILRAKVAIFVALFMQRMQLTQQAEVLREKERATLEAENARAVAEWRREQETNEVLRLEEARRMAEAHALTMAQMSAELVRSNRELQQVAYGASHDLKTPLRGIAAICDWLEEDLESVLTDEARKHFAQLRHRVRRLGNLVDGILAFARVGHVRSLPEDVDIRELIESIVELQPLAPGAVVNVQPNMPVAHVQREQIERVFSNLISNALKYARRDDPHIEIGCLPSDDALEFWVSDNGPGIEKQYHERIWNLFQRLESQDEVEGTGVGLALVKKIVEGQGGRAWVESELGHGATFHFIWPREPAIN